MAHFLLRVVGNGLGLYLATELVPGFLIQNGIRGFGVAALLLTLLNLIVRPVLKLISLPLILLTLGLFTFVINALMLWLLDWASASVDIRSLTALILGTLVVSAVNLVAFRTHHG